MTTQNPAEWFQGARRVLFVHAHPDDETIATGGTLAGLSAHGKQPFLVTLTRGERGEIRSNTKKPGLTLTEQRATELECALNALGGLEHVFLGTAPARKPGLAAMVYEDSGMKWVSETQAAESDDAPETALTRAPAVWALDDLVTLALEIDAEAIVSYDVMGGYGHPDHVLAHKLARAVAKACEIDFYEIVLPENIDGENPTEMYDISEWFEKKMSALRCYETQLQVVSETEIRHVGGQLEEMTRVENFRRLKPL